MCRLCEERGKTWRGDDPKCAFDSGVFSGDNWNCATMNRLRELASELGTVMRRDLDDGSIGYVPIGGTVAGQGYVVMTWYKDRGETGMAIVMDDDEEPKPLTEEIALSAIATAERILKEHK